MTATLIDDGDSVEAGIGIVQFVLHLVAELKANASFLPPQIGPDHSEGIGQVTQVAAREAIIPDQVRQSPLPRTISQVTQCDRICIGHRKVNLSTVFAGQVVGIREVDDKIWLVSFLEYDLGFFDRELNKVEPVGRNPFAPKVLPMLPE